MTSEILRDDKFRIDEHYPGVQNARQRLILYRQPGKITLGNSIYVTGINRHSNKRWFRWANPTSFTVKRSKHGKIIVLGRTENKFFSGGAAWHMAGVLSEGVGEVGRLLKEEFGISGPTDIYPALSVFRKGEHPSPLTEVGKFLIHRPTQNRRKLYRALHNDDPRELVSLLTRQPYRKDIARTMENVDVVNGGRLSFLEFVDPSWAKDILSRSDINRLLGSDTRLRQSAFSLMNACDEGYISTAQHRNILLTEFFDQYEVVDAIRMAPRLLNPRQSRKLFKDNSIREAHEWLIQIQRQQDDTLRNARDNKDIQYDPLVKRIDGASVDGWTIRLAKTGREIKNWGIEMNHCIGSYASEAYAGWAVLGGVYKGDELKANFMLNPHYGAFRLVQMYGYGNSHFDGYDDIVNLMNKENVIV